MGIRWRGKQRHVPIGSKVCVARVLTLMEAVKKQIHALTPGFVWMTGHELYVAIIRHGEQDLVVGYATADGTSLKEMRVAAEYCQDMTTRDKLMEAVAGGGSRPARSTGTHPENVRAS